jgi:hypothetical protein
MMVDPLPPPDDVQRAAARVEAYLQSTFAAAVQDQEGQAQDQGKVTDEQFAKMSAAERLDYARRFDQKQFHAPPSGRRGS